MKNQLSEIYLNMGAEANSKRGDFKDYYEITWSCEAIHENDLEYLSANHITKVIKDRINHLKSDLKGLKNIKMDNGNPVRHMLMHTIETQITEQYWLLHKLGLADEKRR